MNVVLLLSMYEFIYILADFLLLNECYSASFEQTSVENI